MQLTRNTGLFLALVWFAATSPAHAATIIPVPFTSQAPYGDWSEPYQDFCEEASAVMAVHFLLGAPILPKIADQEMRLIQKYEETVLNGRSQDTSIDETASVLRVLYGFKNITTRVVSSPEEIKKEIAAGRIVIAPTSGVLLKNPYFRLPLPDYHMVLIRGFDDAKKTFVTNDPGTRRGNGLVHRQSVLFDAIHDWNKGDVQNGEKRVMIVGR